MTEGKGGGRERGPSPGNGAMRPPGGDTWPPAGWCQRLLTLQQGLQSTLKWCETGATSQRSLRGWEARRRLRAPPLGPAVSWGAGGRLRTPAGPRGGAQPAVEPGGPRPRPPRPRPAPCFTPRSTSSGPQLGPSADKEGVLPPFSSRLLSCPGVVNAVS